MAFQKRILILNQAEQAAFYGNPCLTSNDQRYYFALNDKERKVRIPDHVEHRFPIEAEHPFPPCLSFTGIRSAWL
jgi:hypothetical protein